MFKHILFCLILVGCTPHYIKPVYEPISYEKKTLDLSTYKNIYFKQENDNICLTDNDYQQLLFLFVDLKNFITYQKIVIDALDTHQKNIYKNSLKK